MKNYLFGLIAACCVFVASNAFATDCRVRQNVAVAERFVQTHSNPQTFVQFLEVPTVQFVQAHPVVVAQPVVVKEQVIVQKQVQNHHRSSRFRRR